MCFYKILRLQGKAVICIKRLLFFSNLSIEVVPEYSWGKFHFHWCLRWILKGFFLRALLKYSFIKSDILCSLFVRLISCSILQKTSVLFESFWHHIHHSITVRPFLPVHPSLNTDDLYMTVYSKSGPRFADIILVSILSSLGFGMMLPLVSCVALWFCYNLQSDVVHVHVNPIQPMPSCLHHRFVVRNL